MIVVSDNGPVAFLVQIGREAILPRLYVRVAIPTAVERELRRHGTPDAVRGWLAEAPDWLKVRTPSGPPEREGSGRGEREAIRLAKELGAPLLCDDRQAVSRARREGILVTGTLGVLQAAHARGHVEIETEIDRLRALTDFHLPQAKLETIIEDAHRFRRRLLDGASEGPPLAT